MILNTELGHFLKDLTDQPFVIVADNAKIPSRATIIHATSPSSKGSDRITLLRRSVSDMMWHQKRPSARWRSNSVLPGQMHAPPPRKPSPIFSERKMILKHGKKIEAEKAWTEGSCCFISCDGLDAGNRWNNGLIETSAKGSNPQNRSFSRGINSFVTSGSGFLIQGGRILDKRGKPRWSRTEHNGDF